MGRLKGTVKNDDGSPAADAVVTVSQNNAVKGQDTTGADGAYTIGKLDPGSYQVSVDVNDQERYAGATEVVGSVSSFDINIPPLTATAAAGTTSTTTGSAGTGAERRARERAKRHLESAARLQPANHVLHRP